MRFERLRLSGFKSFVEPTEFRIEPGLTGVVGPNGCGKSNLLEALRWVMGANSAKAMRADGMDDVIFSGAEGRPGRSFAEVSLQIDNADRTAPERFNDDPVIQVSRRIERGAGSAYRVNGVEARARDVQMLFADASTGANSPAMVRQGQISELIAAKPANRRRILEEAAGVSGLHSRRHEAGLRLNAAEANIARLDDVVGEIEQTLARLKREAKKAETYRRLSAEIRALQSAVLHARWREAAEALAAADDAARVAETEVGRAARALDLAGADLEQATAACKPLHEEEMVAAAVAQRLSLDRERLGREAALAEAEVDRLRAGLARSTEDMEREVQAQTDAAAVLARTQDELAEIERRLAGAPERSPALERALVDAGATRAEADRVVEALAAEAAAEAARRQAAQARAGELRRLAAAAQTRRDEAARRLARVDAALAETEREAADLARVGGAGPARAVEDLSAAEAALTRARTALDAADAGRAEAQRTEAAARDAARRADDELRRLKAEAQGLLQLAAAGAGSRPEKGRAWTVALSGVRAGAGLEQAVAAAFGEDLDAALEAGAVAFWGGSTADAGPLPPGCAPLADAVEAPPALAARLSATGLVEACDGARLQPDLKPGQALVSREGDLWRWDGYVATAAAPRPAAARLAQRARLAEIERTLAALQPGAVQATDAHRRASEALGAADAALMQARKAPPSAERAVAAAREIVEREARETARIQARAQALAEAAGRDRAERATAAAALVVAEEDLAAATASVVALPAPDAPVGDAAPLLDARRAAVAAREAEAAARAEADAERRAREGRLRRREALSRDVEDWRRRAETALARASSLAHERDRFAASLADAASAPEALARARATLEADTRAASARSEAAKAALAAAQTAASAAQERLRTLERGLGEARELRAGAVARLDGARDRLSEAASALRESTGLEPDALARELAETAHAIPADAHGVEAHLKALERDRDALGGVNLAAETEASAQEARLTALMAERADLADAIATLRRSIATLNAEGRERLLAAFEAIAASFKALFETLFEGGQAELRLVENDDPLEAGLDVWACPPGKRLAAMSLMSGGEQALTATALIFAVFLANPAPVCVLDEVDAPLDDANVDRFCRLVDEMRRLTETRFLVITHNPVTMSRMDRLYGVTMAERGVSRLVSVDLRQAEALVAS